MFLRVTLCLCVCVHVYNTCTRNCGHIDWLNGVTFHLHHNGYPYVWHWVIIWWPSNRKCNTSKWLSLNCFCQLLFYHICSLNPQHNTLFVNTLIMFFCAPLHVYYLYSNCYTAFVCAVNTNFYFHYKHTWQSRWIYPINLLCQVSIVDIVDIVDICFQFIRMLNISIFQSLYPSPWQQVFLTRLMGGVEPGTGTMTRTMATMSHILAVCGFLWPYNPWKCVHVTIECYRGITPTPPTQAFIPSPV